LEVKFKTKKLAKCYLQSKNAIREFGPDVGKRYIQRIDIIKAIKNLDDLQRLPALRCHPLKGKRKREWAITLVGRYRLVFTLEGEALEIVCIQEVSNHYDD
jgi:proteic killer suppression protein